MTTLHDLVYRESLHDWLDERPPKDDDRPLRAELADDKPLPRWPLPAGILRVIREWAPPDNGDRPF